MSYVIAIDVGAPDKLGWSDNESDSGTALPEAIQKINEEFPEGKVALGFEAPIFLPLNDFENFTQCRVCDDRQHSWSAGAGATVCAISLPLITLCLQKIYQRYNDIDITTDYCTWNKAGKNTLLIWEAFITRNDRVQYVVNENIHAIHMMDARNAVNGFLNNNKSQEPSQCPMLNIPMLLAANIGFNVNIRDLDRRALIVKSNQIFNLTW